jgi:hypothetical protein
MVQEKSINPIRMGQGTMNYKAHTQDNSFTLTSKNTIKHLSINLSTNEETLCEEKINCDRNKR